MTKLRNSRAADDEHRSVNVFDGFLLLGVEVEGGKGTPGEERLSSRGLWRGKCRTGEAFGARG